MIDSISMRYTTITYVPKYYGLPCSCSLRMLAVAHIRLRRTGIGITVHHPRYLLRSL